MLYLIGSVILFSINNVLWRHYTPKMNVFQLISKRAFFTTVFMGIILFLLFLTQETNFLGHLLGLLTVSLVGFLGLFFMVLGFKKGTVLQFSMYSLLLTCVLGFIGVQTNAVSFLNKIPELLIMVFGYLFFVLAQFGTINGKQSLLGHVYFIAAHFCFGILLFLQWHLLDDLSKVSMAFFQELFVFVLAGCIWVFLPAKDNKQEKIGWWQFALFALPICFAVLLGLEGLKSTNPFYSALIGLLTPMFTLMIAIAFGLEKLQWKPMVGFALIIVGLLLFYF